MIARLWHGWTLPENADRYEKLLREEVFPGIKKKKIKGFQRIELLRSDEEERETSFVTIMWFDDLDSVKEFAGEDYKTAYVPDEASKLLHRYDRTSTHYEVMIRE